MNAKVMYDDPDFQQGASSLFWANLGENDGAMAAFEKKQNLTWQRASQAFSSASLFPASGVTPEGLSKDFVGDNWFVAAIAALAEFPGRVEKLFLNENKQQSRTGVYAVNIFTLGFPQTILVDDFLPMTKSADGKSFSTLYA